MQLELSKELSKVKASSHFMVSIARIQTSVYLILGVLLHAKQS